MITCFELGRQLIKSVKRAFVLGWMNYIEKVRKIPLGGVFNMIGPTLLSGGVATLFSIRDEGFDYYRFQYMLVAMFSFLILLEVFFSGFGLAWKQRRLILNSNFGLHQLALATLLEPIMQIVLFFIVLVILFESPWQHAGYLVVFMIWVAGLQQMAKILGAMARWITRIGPLLGRAFFIGSPILWLPQSSFQEVLASINPLLWLLNSCGISWVGAMEFDPVVFVYTLLPIFLLMTCSQKSLRVWYCGKLH